jgi:hypothetical protein
MNESRLGVLPPFVFGHSLLAILAIPSLFDPAIPVKEGFYGINMRQRPFFFCISRSVLEPQT